MLGIRRRPKNLTWQDPQLYSSYILTFISNGLNCFSAERETFRLENWKIQLRKILAFPFHKVLCMEPFLAWNRLEASWIRIRIIPQKILPKRRLQETRCWRTQFWKKSYADIKIWQGRYQNLVSFVRHRTNLQRLRFSFKILRKCIIGKNFGRFLQNL